MKNITKEEIETAVNNATMKFNQDLLNDYIKAVDSLDENTKNNPLAYGVVALSLSQKKTAEIIKETLTKLFC